MGRVWPATGSAATSRRQVTGGQYDTNVLGRSTERRLKVLSRRLIALRSEVAVADEQLAQLADESDDARIRSMVSETPLAGIEATEAQRHHAAMVRSRQDLLDTIVRLEAEQDALLDKLSARHRSSRS
jgi:hypothetical protein